MREMGSGWSNHRRERLVSLVRLSSELALPVGEEWLACVTCSKREQIADYLLALVLV